MKYSGIMYKLTGDKDRPNDVKIVGSADSLPVKGKSFLWFSDTHSGGGIYTSTVEDLRLKSDYIDIKTRNSWYRLVLNG